MNLNHISSMGVINITPNSFSDGNLYNSAESFLGKFNQVCSDFDIIDLGAESTAPFNDSISAEEEINRFSEMFFPLLKANEDNALTISIDTYKVDVFVEIYTEIKKHWPKTQLIFNDVSGKIDEPLLELMNSDLDFSYVYSHNLAPSRAQTGDHMQYLTENDIILHMQNYFHEGIATLKNFNKKIMLDPCFGFSKTREQNHKLLKNLKFVFESIPSHYDLVFGISRKSFLRFPHNMDTKLVENQKELDCLQTLFIKDLVTQITNRQLILRMHDTHSLQAVKNYLHIIS